MHGEVCLSIGLRCMNILAACMHSSLRCQSAKASKVIWAGCAEAAKLINQLPHFCVPYHLHGSGQNDHECTSRSTVLYSSTNMPGPLTLREMSGLSLRPDHDWPALPHLNGVGLFWSCTDCRKDDYKIAEDGSSAGCLACIGGRQTCVMESASSRISSLNGGQG